MNMNANNDSSSALAPPPFVAVELDAQLGVLAVDPEACRSVLGVDADALVGKKLEALVSRRDRRGQHELDRQRAAYVGGLIDVLLQLKIGRDECLARVRIRRHGEGWRAWVENITADGADGYHQLHVENTWWRQVVSKSDEGVMVLDHEDRIVELNQSGLELLAARSDRGVLVSREVLMGQNPFEMFDVDNCATFAPLAEAVRTGRTKKRHRFESTIEHDSRHLDVRVTPVHVSVRGYAGACITLRDVTSRVVIERMSADLRAKNADIQSMLGNLELGICTILPDLSLHPEFSQHLAQMLGGDDLGGRSVLDAIFAHSGLGDDRVAQLEAGLQLSLGQDVFVHECNLHCFPETFVLETSSGPRHIEAEWEPLCSAEDEVERIMLVLRDVTEVLALREQAAQQGVELAMVAELLGISADNFERFAQECEVGLAEALERLDAGEGGANEETKRTLHTLKGNARSWGLRSICDAIHHAEDALDDAPAAAKAVRTAQEVLGRYKHLSSEKLNRKAGRSVPECSSAHHQLVEELLRHVARGRGSLPARVEALAIAASHVPVDQLLEGVLRELAEVAAAGDKAPPLLRLPESLGVRTSAAGKLRGALVLLLTNAVDHGIEPRAERLAKGKRDAGTITLEVMDHDAERVRLSLRDDGAGIDVDGLLGAGAPRSKAALVDKIFAAGVSTARAVTKSSGRGVGMAAVRATVEEFGGHVDVVLERELDGSTKRVPFHFEITLPTEVLRVSPAAGALAA